MKAIFNLSFVFWLAVSGVTIAGEIELEIRTHGSGEGSNEYLQGDTIRITAVLLNNSDHGVPLGLPVTHDGKTTYLVEPPYLLARVVDQTGVVLTQHDIPIPDQEGWWSWNYLSSSTINIVKANEVEEGRLLKPGKSHSSEVRLDEVLWGCPGLTAGLEPGIYTVQVLWLEWMSDPFQVIVLESNG